VAADLLLDLVQLHLRGLGAAFAQEPDDVVVLGHRTLIRTSAHFPD
jgi:hypothetical protein